MPLQTTLETALRLRVPLSGLLLELLTSHAQTAAQADAYRQRCAVLKTDEWLEDTLSFSERSRNVA